MSAPEYQPHSRQQRVDTVVDVLGDIFADFVVYRVFRKKPAQLHFDIPSGQLDQLKQNCAAEWQELVDAREKARKSCDRLLLMGLISSLITAVVSIVVFIGQGLFLAPIPLLIAAYKAAKHKLEFKSLFSEKLLPKILSHMEGFEYQRHGVIPIEEVSASNIIPKHVEKYTVQEDYLRTEIGDVSVEMVECELSTLSRDSKGNSRKSGVFKGLILKLTLPKTIPSRVILQANWGKILGLFQEKPLDKKYRISLDHDNPLGKKFHIYAEDKAHAEQVLNPSFLQHYKRFTDKLDIAAPELSLYDNQCVLLLHRPKDMFMPPRLHGEISQEQVLNPILQELEMIEELTVIALEAVNA